MEMQKYLKTAKRNGNFEQKKREFLGKNSLLIPKQLTMKPIKLTLFLIRYE